MDNINQSENSDKKEKKLLKIFISSRLLDVFNKMIKTGDFQVKTVANRIISLTKSDEYLFNMSYLDIQEDKNDTISFMPAARAWRSLDFKNQEEANVEPSADSPLWNGSGRQSLSVGKLVNKLFDNFSDLAVEKFINAYKAEISAMFIFNNFKLVREEDIRKWYHEKNYSTAPMGDLNNSCMRYDMCQKFLDIYCNNPDKCGLLILTDFNNKLIGRALVWFNLRKPIEKIFMDRIYVNRESDRELFKKYAIQQEWLYKYQQSAHDASYIEPKGQRIQKSISVQLSPKPYAKYPYMDTLKFYNPGTGRLASDPGNYIDGHNRIKLEATDGSFGRID